MRILTVLAVVTIAAWQSSAEGQELYESSPPPLQRVHRLPSSGLPITGSTPLPPVTVLRKTALQETAVQKATPSCKTFAGAPVTTYRQVAPVVPVAAGRYYAYRPMVSISPKLTNYHLGRGIIGQPKVYVPGQPVRNFFRYLSP